MRRFIVLAVVVVVVGIVVAVILRFRNSTTPVGSTDLNVPPDARTYAYETTGFEEVDALSGGRHDYPAQTFLSVWDGECGPVTRWDALAERWTEWHHCGDAGGITETLTLHQWFGVPDLEDEMCPQALPLKDATDSAVPCSDGATTESYAVEVVGSEERRVGGERLMVTHVVRTSELTGATTGTAQAEMWFAEGWLVPVEMRVSSATTTSSAVGDVHYREDYHIVLVSTEPVS